MLENVSLSSSRNSCSKLHVKETQAHVLNFRTYKIENENGIRNLILRRNQLKDDFAISLARVLETDKYIKQVDLAGNKIRERGIQHLISVGFLQNQTLLQIDCRLNPGLTDKQRKQFALCMLKNIEHMQAKDLHIKKCYLNA